MGLGNFGFVALQIPRIRSRSKRQIGRPGAAYFVLPPRPTAIWRRSWPDPAGAPRLRRVRPGGANSRACWGLKWYPRPPAVSVYDRRVQKKESGGLIVSVPYQIAYALGIGKGTTVRFWSVNGKAVFKPIAPDGLTEKDVADIDGYEEAAGEPDPVRGQTRPRARCRCPDGGERHPGVREEPRRMSEADSGRPWWACF